MSGTVTVYSHGDTFEIDESLLYNPFPEETETPETETEPQEETHSDDWANDEEGTEESA